MAGYAARQRVYAKSQRGHAVLHADHASGVIRNQGGGAGADAGQDHQVVSRGRLGLGQGRPCRHCDRPGADGDVRDGDQSQAGERMAAGHDGRQADRGDGQGAAISRRLRCLDHADQGAHRHAFDRNRTPVGVKVLGTDLAEMEKIARQIEAVIRNVPGTTSAYAERVIGGYYLNIDPDRAQLARYGLMVGDLQNLITMALGAEPVTTTVEGRERYAVTIRYPRDYRSDPQAIATEVLIPIPDGGTVPLGQVAKVTLAQGPASIRTENAQLAAYIFVDLRDRDLGGYVADARGGRRPGQVSARLLRHVERPVRISGTRQGPAASRRAPHGANHLPAALPQFPPRDRNPDRHAVGTIRAGRRPLADVGAGFHAKLGVRVQRVMTDNGACYKSRAFGRACKRRSQAHPNQALYAENQWQGRALYPNSTSRVGLCQGLPPLRSPRRRTSALAPSLQLAPSPWQYRRQTAHQQTRPNREQPVEAPQLVSQFQFVVLGLRFARAKFAG